MPAISWLLLILSLPTGNATARQRAWRALKVSGAAVLRDGVYVLPDEPGHRARLEEIAAGVRDSGGMARLLRAEDDASDLRALFDRSDDYAELQADLDAAPSAGATAAESLREARRLRRHFDALVATDFFPGNAREMAEQSLLFLERRAARDGVPDEPADAGREVIVRRHAHHFQNRVWCTRRRPWVDRLASAWLIRRYIDPKARFTWLARPEDCAADAVGFDFDGAEFTHVGGRVTFEVLRESFALDDAGLPRMATLVHHLDVGGTAPPEAAGVETLLAGLRDTHADDDALLEAACGVFDALHASFARTAAGDR